MSVIVQLHPTTRIQQLKFCSRHQRYNQTRLAIMLAIMKFSRAEKKITVELLYLSFRK